MTNRTIKFRAWDTEANLMLHWPDMRSEILDGIPIDMGDEWTDRVVIEQFTGLTDKNNKEIYEGDIVIEDRFDDLNGPRTGYIKWQGLKFDLFHWPVYKQVMDFPGHPMHGQEYEQPYLTSFRRDMTIIGNVHEGIKE